MTPPPPPPLDIDLPLPPPPTEYQIAELVLHTGARVTRFEEKAAFAPLAGLSDLPTPQVAPADALRKSDVLDLTSKMKPDGSLDWTPPAGQWIVLRMGYSLLGITNHPASPEGTGLEVDKLNPEHVKAYMDTYLDNYKSAVGPLMGARGLRFLISDSWEAGAQNWTDRMIDEFTRRRGYDPHPWLPALTGRVVESAAASRSLPVGLPANAVGHARGVPLRSDHRDPEAARHGPLRRIARERTRLHRRRHGGEAQQRRADVGDVDPAAGRQRGTARLQRRHPRIRLGRAPVRQGIRGRRIADGGRRVPGPGRPRPSSPPPTRSSRWA